MTRIGYARTAATAEDPTPQLDTLRAAGCERVFLDHAHGAVADRPELDTALAHLHEGDQLVVCQLDHPARSLAHLVRIVTDLAEQHVGFVSLTERIDTTNPTQAHVFAALATLDHALAAERTRPARDAKTKGAPKGGRPPALTPDKLAQAKAMVAAGEHTMAEIAAAVGVARSTLYRALNPNP